MKNFSLLPHNTFGIEATTAEFLEFASEADLKQLVADAYFPCALIFV